MVEFGTADSMMDMSCIMFVSHCCNHFDVVPSDGQGV